MLNIGVNWNSQTHTLSGQVNNLDQIINGQFEQKIKIEGTNKTYTVTLDLNNKFHVQRDGIKGFFAKLGFGGHLSRSLESRLNDGIKHISSSSTKQLANTDIGSHPLKKSLVKSQSIEQGNNNITTHIGERILKSPVNNMSAMFERSYSEQASNWNQYYAGTEMDSAVVMEDGKLSTPFISGQYPNDKQKAECIKSMYERGFIMEDCRDNRNFIVSGDGICNPVDFGQVIKSDNRFFNVKLHIVSQLYQKLTNEKLY